MVRSVAAAEVSMDGRRARRDRGRLAVIEAVLDLLEEGGAPPLASDVAKRAGVSSATLFRYFETLDELQHEAISRFFERKAPLFEVPQIGVGPLGARADRYAAARADLYEGIAPVARLGRARAFDRPVFAETLHSVRRVMADQIRTHFAPELQALTPAARDDAIALIGTITSFESWDQMGQDFGRTQTQIRRAWRGAIEAACS
jgi:AcrR family transcriptional regulator